MCADSFVFLHICGCMRGQTGDARMCWQDIDCTIEMQKNIKDHEASNIKSRLNEQIIQTSLSFSSSPTRFSWRQALA